MSLSKNLKTLEDQLKNAEEKKVILELELTKLDCEYRTLEAMLEKAKLNMGSISSSMVSSCQAASGAAFRAASGAASGAAFRNASDAASGAAFRNASGGDFDQGSDRGSASSDSGQPPFPSFRTKQCKFFAKGKCTNGDNCNFIH